MIVFEIWPNSIAIYYRKIVYSHRDPHKQIILIMEKIIYLKIEIIYKFKITNIKKRILLMNEE